MSIQNAAQVSSPDCDALSSSSFDVGDGNDSDVYFDESSHAPPTSNAQLSSNNSIDMSDISSSNKTPYRYINRRRSIPGSDKRREDWHATLDSMTESKIRLSLIHI